MGLSQPSTQAGPLLDDLKGTPKPQEPGNWKAAKAVSARNEEHKIERVWSFPNGKTAETDTTPTKEKSCWAAKEHIWSYVF